MKILELEIHNIRGIVHLPLNPQGANMVIWGPNGSGKSAVVDAIDFLLTGRISRLAGAGTSGLTLGRHGPHIDHTPEEARVRALVQLPGLPAPLELQRCMAHPNDLDYDASASPMLEPVLALAKRGQHVLSRREILKYITAEGGTRATEIQLLLNVAEIEEVRKTLVRLENVLTEEHKAAMNPVKSAKAAICAAIQQRAFNEQVVLQVVNQNRTILGGPPIPKLEFAELKRGTLPPVANTSTSTLNATLLRKDVENLQRATSISSQAQLSTYDTELRDAIANLLSNPKLLQELRRLELTELGLSLMDESGSCPLCDTPWPAGELLEYLRQRKDAATVAGNHRDRINNLSKAISEPTNIAIENIKNLVIATRSMSLDTEHLILTTWLRDLSTLSTALNSALEEYPDLNFSSAKIQRLLAPEGIEHILKTIDSAFEAQLPKTTPEQNAWDTLTRLEEHVKSLESAYSKLSAAHLYQRRAMSLRTAFIGARDQILGNLYDNISGRFSELYRQIHEIDENTFTASIAPQGASLDFQVDFYGRGPHPPHALHSEGHQDSMGLCLYLALAEHLTHGLINLVVLDDVVMSVDSDHRRQLCSMLANCFPERQFLITTHDRTWANQLRSDGVVNSRGIVEFYNWHVETGPQVNHESDMWQRIDNELQMHDIGSAAARLRRGSEGFFGAVCDRLRALVVYKQNGRWELGDLMPAAIGRYNSLLRQAKGAANSWGDGSRVDELSEVESIAKAIFRRTNVEQWGINANVHYSNWANFSANDFRPLVEAFNDLYHLFECSRCSSLLYVSMSGLEPNAVRCNCGQVNWNLVTRR